jgi:hypothetical protein
MNAPCVLAEHGAWMFEMRMLRAETPADGLSAAGKGWTSASPGSFHIRVYPTPFTRNGQMSLLGTFLPRQPLRAMSAIGGTPENICSLRGFRILTQLRH